MPSYTFGILYIFAPELIMPLSIRTLPFLFFTTCIIPLASISLMKVMGQISSLKMESREDRKLPFMMVTIYYTVTSYLFIFKLNVNETVAAIFIATGVLLLVVSVVTFWFKISIHAAGVSGLTGLLLALVFNYPSEPINYLFLILVVMSGLTMSARLQLNAHTPKEILLGGTAGLVVCFLVLDQLG